jgi:hypothetical protein
VPAEIRLDSERVGVRTRAESTRRRLRAWSALLALLLILVLAAYLRGVGMNWDEDSRLHPDERFLSMVESGIAPVYSVREYFDTDGSSLNPNNRGYGFFVYGDLPIIAVQYLGRWLERPDNHIDRRLLGVDLGADYDSVHLLGRGVSAVSDVLSTLLVFAIGARLYGRAVGLLAAALYGGAVLPTQQAHFFTVDAIANLFVVLAFWLAVRACVRARWLDDVLFGLALGAGLASKLSIFPVALLLVLGIVVRVSIQRAAVHTTPGLDEPTRRRRGAAVLVRGALSLNLVFLVSLLAFRVLQPYAFKPVFAAGVDVSADRGTRIIRRLLDITAARLNPVWLEQMSKLRALQTGADDSPPNHQWATRAPLTFAWMNLVRFGLGWPLAIAAWLGWAWALFEGVRGRPESWRHVLPVAWIGLFFAWYGAGWVPTMRYLLPLYPILALLAAWLLVRIAAPEHDASLADAAPPARWRRVVGGAAIALVLASTYAYAYAFTRIYTRPHSRLAASQWIYAHVPGDVTLMMETDEGRSQRQIGLPNTWLAPGESTDDVTAPAARRTRLSDGEPIVQPFTLTQSGLITDLQLNDIRVADRPSADTTLTVDLIDRDGGDAVARSCTFTGPFPLAGAPPLHCAIEGLPVEAGHTYALRVRVTGGALFSAGAAIAHEGHWDDAVPLPQPGFDPWDAVYQGYGLDMALEDDAAKRARMQHVLDRSDYIVVSSNRFYGSLSRNPRRWPMSIAYYRALFSGELGFELIGDFASYPALGPWWRADQEAEEAFTVYDHPRVFIFRKTAAYDAARTAAILARVDLARVERRPARQVTDPPAHIELPPPRRQ